MPDTTVPIDDELRADLAGYFAITTAAEMPPGVRRMDVATLSRRRPSPALRLVGPTMALVGAAAVILVGFGALHLHGGGASMSQSVVGGPGVVEPGRGTTSGASRTGPSIAYPGVDAATLESDQSIRLTSPAGHGGATVTGASAQAAAVAAVGVQAGAPGPAVLAWVEAPLRAFGACLCWVVDVPLGAGGASAPAQPASAGHTVLVLIDAFTGRYLDRVSGPGIP